MGSCPGCLKASDLVGEETEWCETHGTWSEERKAAVESRKRGVTKSDLTDE